MSDSTLSLEERIAASEQPESLEFYHYGSKTFMLFGLGRTRADWERIGAHSVSINKELPDD